MDEVKKAIAMVECRNRASRRYYRKNTNPHACPLDYSKETPTTEAALKFLEQKKKLYALTRQQRAKRGLQLPGRNSSTQHLIDELNHSYQLDELTPEELIQRLTRRRGTSGSC